MNKLFVCSTPLLSSSQRSTSLIQKYKPCIWILCVSKHLMLFGGKFLSPAPAAVNGSETTGDQWDLLERPLVA